jgi:hypothetical protein
MNVAESQHLKDRVTTLERQVALLLSERIPQSEVSSADQASNNSTLTVKRGPGRPRKEPEAA